MGSPMGGQGPGGLQKGTGEAELTSPANILFQKMTAPMVGPGAELRMAWALCRARPKGRPGLCSGGPQAADLSRTPFL